MLRNFFIKIKPLVAIMVMIALVVPFAIAPKKAEAIRITGGWLDTVIHIPQLTPIAASTAISAHQSVFQWLQTFVLEALKKRILDMMVDEIIRWVQGGDTPKFVTDWQGFLEDAGNVAAGDFAQELGLGFLCSPFSGQIQLAFAPTTNNAFSSYRNSATCTLDKIVDNIDDFYENFEDGDWIAYQEAWEPQNNIFGTYLLSNIERQGRVTDAQLAAQNEALAGNGFLSTKSCTEKTPLSGKTSKDPSLGKDLDGDGNYGDIASTCQVTTAGKTIGDLVSKAVGSDIDFLINADQLAEYVAAISDAIFNRLIREGVDGLRGVSTDNSPGSGTTDPNDDFIPSGASGCSALGSQAAIDACLGYGYVGGGSDATREELIAAMKATKDDLIELQVALTDLKEVADDLNEFVAEESAGRSATCSDALKPFFETSTPRGVAAYAAHIGERLQAVGNNIATIDLYAAQLDAVPADSTAAYAAIASLIQNQLNAFAVPEGTIDTVLLDQADLKNAATTIKKEIKLCS